MTTRDVYLGASHRGRPQLSETSYAKRGAYYLDRNDPYAQSSRFEQTLEIEISRRVTTSALKKADRKAARKGRRIDAFESNFEEKPGYDPGRSYERDLQPVGGAINHDQTCYTQSE